MTARPIAARRSARVRTHGDRAAACQALRCSRSRQDGALWRTLREQCLDFTGSLSSLHDITVRPFTWVDERYHVSPHGGLLGKTPAEVYNAEPRVADTLDEVRFRKALTVRARRRLRRDNTLSMDGLDWQTDLLFLGGPLVTVAQCLALPDDPPWIKHESKEFPLSPVAPVKNGRRARTQVNRDTPHSVRVPFDPPRTLLERTLGNHIRRNGGEP
jgi:putative transposase